MQFVCNELSFIPLANSSAELEQKFTTLFKAFNLAKEKYDFSHIRFPMNYGDQKVTVSETYFQWVSSLTNLKLQALLLDLCKPPYYDDLEAKELDAFFQSTYRISDSGAPTSTEPTGLPVAYIKSLPAISLYTHEFWLRRKIGLVKVVEGSDDIPFAVYNVCLEADIESKEMLEWVDSSMSVAINNQEMLKRYLGYSRFQVIFEDEFIAQLFAVKEDDLDQYQYTLLLMRDVELHPFSGGMGQTENLKYRGKEASKRVNGTDRLSYSISNNVVTFLACKGHYDFH